MSRLFENKYWYAVGGTEKIKQILSLLDGAPELLKKLTKDSQKSYEL